MPLEQDKEIVLISLVPILWFWLLVLFIECVKHLLFNKTSLYLLSLILATTYLFTPFASLNSVELLTRIEYIFDFSPRNPSLAVPPISYFNLPTTNAFESFSYFDLAE